MKYIRERVLSGEPLCGTWVVLGSSLTAEITGHAGFDWLVLDMEHGMGDVGHLRAQLQALESTPAVPIVRVANNDPVLIKNALDLGASGIMAPMVNTADEARLLVAAMRYPPEGIRGISPYTRPSRFGDCFSEYLVESNRRLLCAVQIETEAGARNADAIAAVEGVDMLFVGPYDLSTGLGVPRQFDHPTFTRALEGIVGATRAHGKAAGMLVVDPAMVPEAVARGFSAFALGSDALTLATSLRRLVEGFRVVIG